MLTLVWDINYSHSFFSATDSDFWGFFDGFFNKNIPHSFVSRLTKFLPRIWDIDYYLDFFGALLRIFLTFVNFNETDFRLLVTFFFI